MSTSTIIKLDCTHSALSMRLAEIRFRVDMTIKEVKNTLEMKFGGLSSEATLELQDTTGHKVAIMNDNDAMLGHYGAQQGFTIHVIENADSKLGDLEDLSQVAKYKMSDDDYKKRDGTFLKFKQQMMDEHPELKEKAKALANQFQEQAKEIQIGKRCEVMIGARRGEVKFVGKAKTLGPGYWVGVKLDEPTGNCNGSVDDTQFFECPAKYGIFVRPNELKTGEYPPLDEFNEDEDEI